LEDWKIKISVLWLFKDMALLTALTLGSLEPGILEKFLSTGTISGTKIGPEVLLLFAVVALVPLIMAFLSLILKDSIDRFSNITLGIVFSVLGLIDLAETAATPSAWAILIGLSEIAATVLIVWYAWKSKTENKSIGPR
jgi:hypothetical protein